MNNLSDINNEQIDLSISAFDHSEPETDDCGLPENPIFQITQSIFGKVISEAAESRRIKGCEKA
jgi:hypothetical protein